MGETPDNKIFPINEICEWVMSSVVQVLSPQAEELQAKRRELAQLRKNLADMELHLSTEKSELNLF